MASVVVSLTCTFGLWMGFYRSEDRSKSVLVRRPTAAKATNRGKSDQQGQKRYINL